MFVNVVKSMGFIWEAETLALRKIMFSKKETKEGSETIL